MLYKNEFDSKEVIEEKVKTDKYMEIQELLISLANKCQSYNNAKIVASIVTRQHRSHQQCIGRFIQEVIKSFSNSYEFNHTDLRNEATCEMCHSISEKVDEFNLPFI